MHFTKIFNFIALATLALASPLHPGNATLIKREESDGQAGAYINAGDGVSFAFVYGSAKMPDLGKAASPSKVSYWIRIDGINTNRVIQAGFDASKDKDGKVVYEAFYEWYPNRATFISTNDFSASAGDGTITVAIAKSGVSAQAAFVNKKTVKSYNTPTFYSPDEDSDATGINAQWVVEKVPEGDTFANFGTLSFTDCSAADSGGFQYYLTGGATLDLVQDGKKLATGAIVGDNGVDATYTGS